MRLCSTCGVPMKKVMSFKKGKNEKFYRCEKCNSETKHNVLRNDELSFEEVLHNRHRNR